MSEFETNINELIKRLKNKANFGSNLSKEDASLIESVMRDKVGDKITLDGKLSNDEREAILKLQTESKYKTPGKLISVGYVYSEARDQFLESIRVEKESANLANAISSYNERLEQLNKWRDDNFIGDNIFRGYPLGEKLEKSGGLTLEAVKTLSQAVERRAKELATFEGGYISRETATLGT